jgi:hypothetical protein
MSAHEDKSVARPLKVLVELIAEDLRLGDEAAKRASLPYYRAAGEKILEAKAQLKHGEFMSWIERNLKISERQARRYMALAGEMQNGRGRPFSTLSQATGDDRASHRTTWHEPVKEAINRVDVDALQQAALKLGEERELQRKLALDVIDIGYKALAAKLHPDKGGSPEAMTRLNEVRDRAKRNGLDATAAALSITAQQKLEAAIRQHKRQLDQEFEERIQTRERVRARRAEPPVGGPVEIFTAAFAAIEVAIQDLKGDNWRLVVKELGEERIFRVVSRLKEVISDYGTPRGTAVQSAADRAEARAAHTKR